MSRKIILAYLFALLICLSACGGKSANPTPTPEETQLQTTAVSHQNDCARIALSLPDNWEYSVEEKEGAKSFCISLWPKGEEGRLALWYYQAFGVCGTGLSQKTITLGKYTANQGTYLGSPLWDYIVFSDVTTTGDFVAMNEGIDSWWDRYETQAMEILSSLILESKEANQ